MLNPFLMFSDPTRAILGPKNPKLVQKWPFLKTNLQYFGSSASGTCRVNIILDIFSKPTTMPFQRGTKNPNPVRNPPKMGPKVKKWRFSELFFLVFWLWRFTNPVVSDIFLHILVATDHTVPMVYHTTLTQHGKNR